jgi:integrase
VKSKPKGARYRNLFARGDVIYYERVVGGKRIRRSCETADWAFAAQVRDAFEQRKGIGRLPVLPAEAPRLDEFSLRYLAEDTSHLAPTTQQDRKLVLRPDGPVIRSLGARRLDALTPAVLREWWNAEVTGAGRSTKIGRNYLDALSKVLGYAVELGIIEASPVGAFREALRQRGRTKSGRAASEPGQHVRPIEQPEQLHRLVAEARGEGAEAEVLVLLLLDAGLRLGEALGLTWGGVAWGESEDDTARSLLIERNRARGGAPSLPKSGRARRVALSRRLRRALVQLYQSRFAPGPERHVVERIEPSNFRNREWRRICARAGIGHRAPKDLRDTFASQLLTSGVSLGYVSRQLGHADVSVTARHYARWCGGDSYREPMPLEPREVPADLLARLPESPQSPPTSAAAEIAKPSEP